MKKHGGAGGVAARGVGLDAGEADSAAVRFTAWLGRPIAMNAKSGALLRVCTPRDALNKRRSNELDSRAVRGVVAARSRAEAKRLTT